MVLHPALMHQDFVIQYLTYGTSHLSHEPEEPGGFSSPGLAALSSLGGSVLEGDSELALLSSWWVSLCQIDFRMPSFPADGLDVEFASEL